LVYHGNLMAAGSQGVSAFAGPLAAKGARKVLGAAGRGILSVGRKAAASRAGQFVAGSVQRPAQLPRILRCREGRQRGLGAAHIRGGEEPRWSVTSGADMGRSFSDGQQREVQGRLCQ